MVKKFEIISQLGPYSEKKVVLFDEGKIDYNRVVRYIESGVESYRDYFLVISESSYNLLQKAVKEKGEISHGK